MSTPSIDVVIPAHNAAATIERAIRGVLEQDLEHFSLIVVDDGSTDTTADVVTAIGDPRIELHSTEQRGVSAARNRGVEIGSADIIVFLDADDEPLQGWLRWLATPGLPLVRCGYIAVEPDGTTKRIDGTDTALLPGAFAVSRPLFTQVGGYDEEFTHSENTDLWMRLRDVLSPQNTPVAYIDQPLARRYRPAAATATKYGHAALVDASERLLTKHGASMSTEAIASHSAVAGYNSLALGQRQRAKQHLKRAVRLTPYRWRYLVRLAQAYVPAHRGKREGTAPDSPNRTQKNVPR
ncbi:MAG: glycosyltransferase family A protein [Actinomycetota bacterium]